MAKDVFVGIPEPGPRKQPSRWPLVILGLIAITLVAAGARLASFMVTDYMDVPHRSDSQMLKWFREHEEELETLRQQIVSGAMSCSLDGAHTDVWPERWTENVIGPSEAIAKLCELPLEGFHFLEDEGEIAFPMTSKAWLGGETVKGITWKPRPPAHCVDDVDEARRDYRGDRPWYRRIKGNWYIFCWEVR